MAVVLNKLTNGELTLLISLVANRQENFKNIKTPANMYDLKCQYVELQELEDLKEKLYSMKTYL